MANQSRQSLQVTERKYGKEGGRQKRRRKRNHEQNEPHARLRTGTSPTEFKKKKGKKGAWGKVRRSRITNLEMGVTAPADKVVLFAIGRPERQKITAATAA